MSRNLLSKNYHKWAEVSLDSPALEDAMDEALGDTIIDSMSIEDREAFWGKWLDIYLLLEETVLKKQKV